MPFAIGLEIFGMESKRTFSAQGVAECSDLIDYISTVTYVDVLPDMLLGGSAVISAIDSWMNVVKDIITFND